ncbi:MAG: hypothetical protein ACR2LE_02550 [Nocardioidaceae bacterium]
MRLKVLLPDGKVQRFPNDASRKVVDGKLTIVDKAEKELASFEKGKWTAVGRMRVASETSDD